MTSKFNKKRFTLFLLICSITLILFIVLSDAPKLPFIISSVNGISSSKEEKKVLHRISWMTSRYLIIRFDGEGNDVIDNDMSKVKSIKISWNTFLGEYSVKHDIIDINNIYVLLRE